jgi:hypothetical protein
MTASVLRSAIKYTLCTFWFQMLIVSNATVVKCLIAVTIQRCSRVTVPRTFWTWSITYYPRSREFCSKWRCDKHQHSEHCHVTMVLWREWPGVMSVRRRVSWFNPPPPPRIMIDRESAVGGGCGGGGGTGCQQLLRGDWSTFSGTVGSEGQYGTASGNYVLEVR